MPLTAIGRQIRAFLGIESPESVQGDQKKMGIEVATLPPDPRLHALLSQPSASTPLPHVAATTSDRPQEGTQRITRSSYFLFLACLQSRMRAEHIEDSALKKINQESFTLASLEEMIEAAQDAGLSNAAVLSLKGSLGSIANPSAPDASIMGPIPIANYPTYYEVNSGDHEGIALKPVALPDQNDLGIDRYRLSEISEVVDQSLTQPITIASLHRGWHHKPEMLFEALRQHAQKERVFFLNSPLQDLPIEHWQQILGANDAMMVLEIDFAEHPTPPAELVNFLRDHFFSLNPIEENTIPQRHLVVLATSTWMSHRAVAMPWRNALASVAAAPGSLLQLKGIDDLHVFGFNLKQLNLQQTWDILGHCTLNYLHDMLKAGLPLLPLALKGFMAERRNATTKAEKEKVLERYARAFREHGKLEDQDGLHLIIPQKGNWGPYIERAFGLARTNVMAIKRETPSFTEDIISLSSTSMLDEPATLTPTPSDSLVFSRSELTSAADDDRTISEATPSFLQEVTNTREADPGVKTLTGLPAPVQTPDTSIAAYAGTPSIVPPASVVSLSTTLAFGRLGRYS